MKFLNLIFFLLLFASCADMHKREELASIESLHKSLDSITTVLIENNFTEIEDFTIESLEVAQKIKDNYNSDTINLTFAKKLDAYREMLLSFQPLKKAYSLLLKNTKKEKISLTKLKDDIINGNGERAKYQEFIHFEKIKTQQIRQLLNDYVLERKKTIETHQKLYNEIDEYSFNLIAK
jgi:hypothetical protein